MGLATFIFLFGVTVAVGTTLIARAVRRYVPWRMAVSHEPMWRQCGYIICQGASATCPECGSDLRSVGVISARHVRPEYPLGVNFASAIVLMPVALLVGDYVAKKVTTAMWYDTLTISVLWIAACWWIARKLGGRYRLRLAVALMREQETLDDLGVPK